MKSTASLKAGFISILKSSASPNKNTGEDTKIASLKKDIKDEYAIPVATITKVATIVRKQNLSEEDEKWEEIKDWVETCS